MMRAIGQLTAILICVLAAAALAVSQAFVIHDHVAKIHGRVTTLPPWPDWAQWTMSAGFELAIVAVGLAVAITGFRGWLTVAELFLVAVSVLAGALVTHPGRIWPWADTLSMSLVPLQYVAVILAAHSLYGHFAAGGQTAGRAPRVVEPVTTTDRAEPPASSPRPIVARTTTADPAAMAAAIAAIAAGVPRTTARRWLAKGDERLDQYRPRRNGHARPAGPPDS